jgi:hypothetical protein
MPTVTLRDRIRLAGKALVGTYSDQIQGDALKLLTDIYPAAMGAYPTRGTRQTLEAFSTMPWLRAVERKISNATAAVTWQLFVPRRAGQRATRNATIQRADKVYRSKAIKAGMAQQEIQEITDHPFLDMWAKGNSFHTGLSVRRVVQEYVDLVGDAFLLKERNGVGAPIALWPIPGDWILSTPTPSHRFFRVSFRAWQGEIPDTEILWINDMNPANPYGRGSGNAQALADELQTDENAAKFVGAFFRNSARPDILISPKEGGTMLPSETLRLETDWNNKNRGFWNAFKSYFLSRAVDVHEFSGQSDLRAMQITELRKQERDMIIQVLGGFPPEMLGIIESSNRATISGAKFLFDTECIVPRLEFKRAYFQEKLIPEYDDRLIVDYVSPVEEDNEFALKAAIGATWALTVDEWRAMQGLPSKEDGSGKVHMVPFNLTPTTDFTPAPAPLPVLPTPVPGDGGGKP